MKLVEKKIKEKKKISIQKSCQMFVILYLYLIAFELCVNSERILTKRRHFMIFRTACNSIKQRSKLLLFCCFKKNQELQCNGLTSKHSNSFFIVFIA